MIDSWQFRGIFEDPQTGRDSRVYLGFVPELSRVVRVAVSMDETRILSAFPDRNATRNHVRGNIQYFIDSYRDLEERYGP